MQRVTVDTTAQTKAVAHPTDSHLLLRANEWLNKLASKQGVELRQSYLRLATRARREVARLIHGRGHKQAMPHLRKMRTWTGRLVRDIERKIAGKPDLEHACAPKLERIKAFLAQKPDDKNKIYALHAPEVECIAKSLPSGLTRGARRACATNSASRHRSPSPTPAPTAGSSSSASARRRAFPTTDTP